ncbi:Nif3-like dinuclear metal center hexameric protein, partial [Staphylococcus aureus]|nr:Nif3-like dinuclear metal center hexameric protein [Staphylococcus aureus]
MFIAIYPITLLMFSSNYLVVSEFWFVLFYFITKGRRHHVPFSTAESWDNVGLLIGDGDVEVTGVLTALDCTLEVVNEA